MLKGLGWILKTCTTLTSIASKDDVSTVLLRSKTHTVTKLKVLSWNHDHHSPTLKFLIAHTPTIHIPPQLQAHTQLESSCAQEERLEQVSQCLETVYTSIDASNMPSGPQKLERSIRSITQVCGLHQPHSWMVSRPTVHSDDKPVSSGNQCTYIDTMTSIM